MERADGKEFMRSYAAAQVMCILYTAASLCVVIAAHRATKSHAFVQCIRALDAKQARYRILALSATPGADLNAVRAALCM